MSGLMSRDESAYQIAAGGWEMIESAAHGNNEHTNHFHSVSGNKSRLHQPSVPE